MLHHFTLIIVVWNPLLKKKIKHGGWLQDFNIWFYVFASCVLVHFDTFFDVLLEQHSACIIIDILNIIFLWKRGCKCWGCLQLSEAAVLGRLYTCCVDTTCMEYTSQWQHKLDIAVHLLVFFIVCLLFLLFFFFITLFVDIVFISFLLFFSCHLILSFPCLHQWNNSRCL